MKKNKKLTIFSGIAILITGAACLYYFYSTKNDAGSFSVAYRDYRVSAGRHESAVYLPGAEDNTVRQDLHRVLSGVLTEDMDPSERLTMSQKGLELIRQMDGQIDRVGVAGEGIGDAVGLLRKASGSMKDGGLYEKALAISNMAEKERDIIADIRGLSYNANARTKKIFQRIIKNNGVLADDHIIYLNEQTAEEEKLFDQKSALYAELGRLVAQMERNYRDIVSEDERW